MVTASTATAQSARLTQMVNGLALAVLLSWIGYDALGTNLFGAKDWPDSVVDYRILYDASRQINASHAYLPSLIFPYPPSAVVLFLLTAWPAFSVAAALWLTLTILATLGTIRLGMSLVGLADQRWRWPAALLAFVLVEWFIKWDLRSQNSNTIYCFLLTAALAAVQQGRPRLGGMLLAGSIALKLYPVLVLPYWWWIGQRRAFLSGTVSLVGLFVLLPLATFGLDTVQVYASWLDQLRSVAANLNQTDHPILIALPYTLSRLTDSTWAPWLAKLASLLWLAAVAACLLAERTRTSARTNGWNLAVDGGVLALTPVVISPYLEPYHPLPALLLTLALVQRVTDAALPSRLRMIALAGLLAGGLALRLAGSAGFQYRGLGVLTQMLLLVTTLALIRRWPQTTQRAAGTLRVAA